MSDYQPIACMEHERLEFAVLRRFLIILVLKNGRILNGRALDVYTKEGAEWLKLREVTGTEHILRLDEIARIREQAGTTYPDLD